MCDGKIEHLKSVSKVEVSSCVQGNSKMLKWMCDDSVERFKNGQKSLTQNGM